MKRGAKSVWAMAAATVCLAGALTACGPANDTAPATEEPAAAPEPSEVVAADFENYVALGDSYASMGTRDDLVDGSPRYCARSVDNYASYVAEAEGVDDVTDVTCQGARIDDLLQPRDTGSDDGVLPPQVDAVTPEADLVTLSIGGNDIGFGDIVRCVTEAQEAGVESDCDSLDQIIQSRLAELPGRLDSVYATIRENHGDGDLTIVTTGYIQLLDAADTCETASLISETDRFWAAALTLALNTVVKDAAERNGAIFVNPHDDVRRTICAPVDERWVDATGQETSSYPMHPTPAGQEAMGREVVAALAGR